MLSRASREDRGAALVGVGGLFLFVSLFLNWYEPGRSAWTVFEVWDLVLAVLAVVAVVGAAGRLGMVARRPDSWLTGPAVASFLIVLVALINHPPAATGAAPMFGLWLALFASLVMLAGVALSVAGVSVAINLHSHGHGHGDAPSEASPASTTPSASPAGSTPSGHTLGRWLRHHGREHGAGRSSSPESSSPPARSPSPESSPPPARVPTPPPSGGPPPVPPRRRPPQPGAEPPTQVTEPQDRPDPRRPSG